MFVTRVWNLKLDDGEVHVVKLQAPSWYRGWPAAFHVDAQRHPIKLRLLSLARRFEFPFEIAGHRATLIMSKRPLSEVWWRRFNAALAHGRRGVERVDRWSYELSIDGDPVSAD